MTEGGACTLHEPNPLVTADLDGNGVDEVVIDFGPGSGIWVWYQQGAPDDSGWAHLHHTSSVWMVAGDLDGMESDELIIDFGLGSGIWVLFNSTEWVQLHGTSTQTPHTLMMRAKCQGEKTKGKPY
ncbi:MAG: hypothetical protein ABIK28_07425 [Planctomycetota bacterium]